jgi:glycerol-3-phosphate acyltransferase PlsY
MHPVYLKFKPSGKGVATTLGCLLPIAPSAALICISAFLSAAYLSRRVSVGSLAGAFILPPAVWFTTGNPTFCATAIMIMVLILVRHKDNLQRLANGCEPTVESGD